MARGSTLLPDGSLLYVWLKGHVTLRDAYSELVELSDAGKVKHGVPVVIDLAQVESFERDAGTVIEMSLEIVQLLGLFGKEALVIIHAPTEKSREMARIMRDLWEASDVVLVRIAMDELGALMILARRERAFADLGLVPA